MTYEKLLIKINSYLQDIPVDYGQVDLTNALRAVVELHKPEAQEHGQYEKCWNCSLLYPCPTIQAIEKYLKL